MHSPERIFLKILLVTTLFQSKYRQPIVGVLSAQAENTQCHPFFFSVSVKNLETFCLLGLSWWVTLSVTDERIAYYEMKKSKKYL